MGKVIKFPNTTQRVHKDQEHFEQDLIENKIDYVSEVAAHYSGQIYNKLAMHGFNTETDSFYKDYSYFTEALHSCLMRSVGVEHPLQQTVDKEQLVVDK